MKYGAGAGPFVGGPHGHSPTESVSRATVLVVEDDAPTRWLVCRALEDEGYRALGAADGAAALVLVEREPEISLVLLDLWMPIMDGWQFGASYRLLESRRDSPLPPLLLLTAEDGRAAARHAEHLGAVGFVCKPFDLEDLLAAVARCARTGAPATATSPPTDDGKTGGASIAGMPSVTERA